MSKSKIPNIRKQRSISRTAWSSGNTTLDKFSQKSDESLEEFVGRNKDKIKKNRIDTFRAVVKYAYPQIYYGILVAEMLYKNRDAIVDSLEDIVSIWSEDTPITDKLMATGGVVLDTSLEIVKKKSNRKIIIQKVSNEFAEHGVEVLEEEGFTENIASNINLPNHEERFKDLLQDTISNQTSNIINSMI